MNQIKDRDAGLASLLDAVKTYILSEYSNHLDLQANETIICDLQIQTHPEIPRVLTRLASIQRTRTKAVWRTREKATFTPEDWKKILALDWSKPLRRKLEFIRKRKSRSVPVKSIRPEVKGQDSCSMNTVFKKASLPYRFYYVGESYWYEANLETFTVPMSTK
jgi:hypothetical protein